MFLDPDGKMLVLGIRKSKNYAFMLTFVYNPMEVRVAKCLQTFEFFLRHLTTRMGLTVRRAGV